MPFPADVKRIRTETRFPILKIAMPLALSVSLAFASGCNGSSSNAVAAAGTQLDFNQQVIPVGRAPGSVAIADVNHDGKPDIIVANTIDGTLSVLLGVSENPDLK